MELAAAVGLVDARIVERFDSYAGSGVDRKVAAAVGVHGANFFARRPEGPGAASRPNG